MNRAFVRPLLVAVLLVAAGCADQPEKPSSTQIAQPEMPATPPDEPADEVERLLALAARGDGAVAREARLDAAAELVRRGDLARAATLLDELERIRGTRISVSLGETFPESGAIAAPIFDANGTLLAAIAIGAPVMRLEHRLMVLRPLLREVAMRASR